MSKRNIIVVDDQSFICETVTEILKSTYDVRSFTSGKSALDYLETKHVDLILLDYDMPGMTGYEVLMNIKGHKDTKNIPVIFLTAETNERMKHEMVERGASAYICKPIGAAILTNTIRDHLPK